MSAILPSLIRRVAIAAGSRRVSVTGPPYLPPSIKLLTAAAWRCSSSIARRFRLRMKTRIPPAKAANPSSPKTIPTATPALFGSEGLGAVLELDSGLAVTTTVCPPTVTMEGLAEEVADDFEGEVVEDEDEEDESDESEFSTTADRPVRYRL